MAILQQGVPAELIQQVLDLNCCRLRREEVAQLASAAHLRSLEPGQRLLSPDAPVDAVYFVIHGEITVAPTLHETTHSYRAGECIGGALGSLGGGACTATATAAQASEVLKLPLDLVRALIKAHPALARWLLNHIDVVHIRHELRRLPMFVSLDDDALGRLADVCTVHSLSADEVLFRQGDEGNALYLLVAGRLRVIHETDIGEKVLREISAGEIVGELAILSTEPRMATLRAIRASQLIRLGRDDFINMAKAMPDVLLKTADIAIQRARDLAPSAREPETVSTIAVMPAGNSGRFSTFARLLCRTLETHGSAIHLDAQKADGMLQAKMAQTAPGDSANGRMVAWLTNLERQHRFVVFETDPTPTPWTRRCLGQADRIYLVADADGSTAHNSTESELFDPGRATTPASIELVLHHPADLPLPKRTSRWLETREVDHVHHLRDGNDGDVARIGRFLAGRAVGVALSGGGARGFGHLGAVRAIREAGIPVDFVGGTSAGALLGAQFAMGLDPDEILHRTTDLLHKSKAKWDLNLPIFSLLQHRYVRLLEALFGDVCIEDLWTEFFCVSADIASGQMVVHRRGDVGRWVRASSAMPVLLPPELDGESVLVDGGILNNLPCDVMRTVCKGCVIAVDVSSPGELELDPRYTSYPSPWHALWQRLNPRKAPVKLPGIVDILWLSMVCRRVHESKEALKHADVYINIPDNGTGLMAFEKAQQQVEIGYHHTVEYLESRLSQFPLNNH